MWRASSTSTAKISKSQPTLRKTSARRGLAEASTSFGTANLKYVAERGLKSTCRGSLAWSFCISSIKLRTSLPECTYSEGYRSQFQKCDAMIDVSQILPKLVTASCRNDELLEIAARLAWTRVAVAGLRQQVVPFRLYRKTLIVAVADAIWQKQLHQMSGDFVVRINRMLGSEIINSIEFRIDPVTAGQHRTLPCSAESGIKDSGLRQRFMRAAANCVTRRDARRHNQPSL